MDVESELDQLFQAPIGRFVERRDDLAQRLRVAGHPDEASRVRALQRPTPAAWAVNQLAYQGRDLLDAVRDASQRVRAAQQSGQDAAAIVEASRERAEARRRAEHRARGFLTDASRKASANVERHIAALLDAYAAGTLEAEPGRLVRDAEALGFEAFDEVLAPPVREHKAHHNNDAPKSAKRLKLAQKTDRRSELASLVDAAAKRARDLEAESRRARARVDRATRDAAEAESRLMEARAELEAALAESARAAAELGEAERIVAQARKELGEFRR